MSKYRIVIVCCQQEVESYEFNEDRKEDAKLCYYINSTKPYQYTRLYVDDEIVKGHKKIENIFGRKPNMKNIIFKSNQYKFAN